MSSKLKTLLSFCLLFSSVLSFLSWQLSHHSIPPIESTITWALNTPSASKAGFPIEAFEIPQSPLGDDFIPAQMHKGLILNSLFWIIIGTISALIVMKYAPTWSEKTRKYAAGIGIIAILMNAMLFMIWFD